MKKIAVFVALIILASCSKQTKNTQIIGLVKDLKKGTLYLEKVKDTAVVVIDSFIVSSESPFLLETDLEEPEVFSLRLDKNSKDEEKIVFFAEPGITDIKTTLKNFALDAEVEGAKLQEKYAEYKSYIDKFNEQGLYLIKSNIESLLTKNEDSVAAVEARNANYLKRKYLFSTNFAVNNSDLEIAPYIAISELYDAKIGLLDTINNSLTPKIKASKYGKQLQEFINTIRIDSLY